MQKGWVQAVLVGADRIAANGDTANKIGTCGVAVLAKYYNIPFLLYRIISAVTSVMIIYFSQKILLFYQIHLLPQITIILPHSEHIVNETAKI